MEKMVCVIKKISKKIKNKKKEFTKKDLPLLTQILLFLEKRPKKQGKTTAAFKPAI